MISLFEAAAELQAFLKSEGCRFCFIGGLALQRWGQVRLTLDVDVTLLTGLGDEERYIDLLCSRYALRRPDGREFALLHRVLLLESSKRVPLDIALAGFPFEEQVVRRASEHTFSGGSRLLTCSAEDLVILKAFADRAQDWVDIENVLIRQGPRLDRDYILPPLAALAELKEAPEIVDRLRALFAKTP